jgi:hypothetical protein
MPHAKPAPKPAGLSTAELAQRKQIADEELARVRHLEAALGPGLARFAIGAKLKK